MEICGNCSWQAKHKRHTMRANNGATTTKEHCTHAFSQSGARSFLQDRCTLSSTSRSWELRKNSVKLNLVVEERPLPFETKNDYDSEPGPATILLLLLSMTDYTNKMLTLNMG